MARRPARRLPGAGTEDFVADDAEDAAGLTADAKAVSAARSLLFFAERLGTLAERQAVIEAFKADGRATPAGLVAHARTLSVELVEAKLTADELLKGTDPVIIGLRDGRFAVLIRASADTAAVFGLTRVGSMAMPCAKLLELWSGSVLRCPAIGRAGERAIGVRTFLRDILRFKGVYSSVVLAAIFVHAVELTIPLTFLIVVDSILVTRASATLDVVIVILLVMVTFAGILSELSERVLSHLNRRMGADLSARFTRHVLTLPLSFYRDVRGMEILSRISEIVQGYRVVSSTIAVLWIDLAFIMVCFAIAFYFSWLLGLLVVLRLPFYLMASLGAIGRLRRALREQQQSRRDGARLISDTLEGIETIKARHAEGHMASHIERRVAQTVEHGDDSMSSRAMVERYTTTIDRFATAALLWAGGYQVIAGSLTAGQIMAVYLISRQMNRPMNRLTQAVFDFQRMNMGIDEINRFFERDPEIASRHLIRPRRVDGHIRFDRVCFRYADGMRNVLQDVTFHAPPGEILGIVGPSGSGKSTILKLIQKLYAPDEGRIRIDDTGTDILHPYWLREQIGYVPQDYPLFGQTVADNIRLGSPNVSKDDVIEAARLADAHDFITRLPKGYDTVVQGVRTFSGGERQRIAIARAIVHKPTLLLFDEATSSLDHETEQTVMHNLHGLFRGRTVIIVAHRLSALRSAHRIITLDQGRIVEVGTPDELVHSGGYFARMVEDQAGMIESMRRGRGRPEARASAAPDTRQQAAAHSTEAGRPMPIDTALP
jgi:subfamily B ATP-binding cassette protein HlyB/CyaB